MFYIFKRIRTVYVLDAESEEKAWEKLAQKQSMSIKNAKLQYDKVKTLTDDTDFFKLKLY